MKKLILILLIITLSVVYLFATHNEYFLRNKFYRPSLGSTTWSISSTNADTSEIFDSAPTMTLGTWAADTSGDDSVNITLIYEALGVNWDSSIAVTISSDSLDYSWLITTNPVASFKKARIRAYGNAGNKKLSPVLLKLKYSGHE